MKKYFNNLIKDRLVTRLFIISALLLILTLIIILINYTKLPPLLPVFNQFPWGKERLTSTPGIFIPLIIVISYFFLNLLLSMLSYSKYPLIARIFAVTTSLISLLTLLFVIRTISLIL
jgi:hypothetical protein